MCQHQERDERKTEKTGGKTHAKRDVEIVG